MLLDNYWQWFTMQGPMKIKFFWGRETMNNAGVILRYFFWITSKTAYGLAVKKLCSGYDFMVITNEILELEK
jgi:hypothetical protein